MTILEQIYEELHEPEELGLTKILTTSSRLFATYLLDFVLLRGLKLSKCLQSQNSDLTLISSLLDATLHTLNDVIQPAANRLL